MTAAINRRLTELPKQQQRSFAESAAIASMESQLDEFVVDSQLLPKATQKMLLQELEVRACSIRYEFWLSVCCRFRAG
jgi:hypothetical protein